MFWHTQAKHKHIYQATIAKLATFYALLQTVNHSMQHTTSKSNENHNHKHELKQLSNCLANQSIQTSSRTEQHSTARGWTSTLELKQLAAPLLSVNTQPTTLWYHSTKNTLYQHTNIYTRPSHKQSVRAFPAFKRPSISSGGFKPRLRARSQRASRVIPRHGPYAMFMSNFRNMSSFSS